MKLSVKPSNTTEYHLRLEPGDPLYTACMWADIMLNHDTYTLFVESDCGNYTCGWTPTPDAESFLHLMCRLDSSDLLSKISDKTEFFLEESKKATIKNIRNVGEDDYDDGPTKNQIKDLCTEIMDIEDCGEECFCRMAVASMDDHDLMDSFEILSVVKDYPAGAKTFVKLFCEVLQPELHKQLAEQGKNVTGTARQPAPATEDSPMDQDQHLLHVYAQGGPHDDAQIVGTKAALSDLRDAINKALASGREVRRTGMFTADGEGFDILVQAQSDKVLTKMPEPYTDEIYRKD